MYIAGLRPTSEQIAVIDACVADANVVLEAGAGTGKTSTLRMIASQMGDRRGMYLACNRGTADAARRAFPKSVECVTAHSLAYRAVGYRYADRLPGQAARMPSWAVASVLGIGEPLPLGDNLILTRAHLARIVMGTIEQFCHSADTTVSAAHVPRVHGVNATAFAELTWHIVPIAQRAWLDIQRPDGQLPVKHDHYLKLWQLTSPQIPAAFVMFDEAQDANPVTAAIVQGQRSGQRIIVGDSCQAIYGWRGAVDTLGTWPTDVKLNLTQSWRFGADIADEANKWLTALRAPFRLSGNPSAVSAVEPVTDPQVILCRTNAEAFLQARSAVEAGQRAALGSGAADLKHLAGAALDLRAAGQTNHPELAAFRSWPAIREYVRTDAAGADLAAGVRLIDKYGASAILGFIDKLSRENRADVTACTAHAAKGREWERVLIADDFPEPSSATTAVPRAEAMLAYVAVTRARSRLGRSGLAWIDNHQTVTTRTEATMNTRKQIGADPLEPDAGDAFRPYAGGRAQAESGCRVIAADYDAWKTVTSAPPDHPKVTQLGQAWRAIVKRDLGDDPGPAAIRYQMLSHAAAALATTTAVRAQPTEAAILARLTEHSRLHAGRLRATADEHFRRSRKAGPYTGGRVEAVSGGRIVEKDYLTWSRSPAAAKAAKDNGLFVHVKRLREAWDQIRRHGLADGPRPTASRYTELADASAAVADNFLVSQPATGLEPLLDLAGHARKHAIRLQATADAGSADASNGDHDRVVALAAGFEVRSDSDLASLTDRARSSRAPADTANRLEQRVSRREARVRRYSRGKSERE
jgi:hypothetical protein